MVNVINKTQNSVFVELTKEEYKTLKWVLKPKTRSKTSSCSHVPNAKTRKVLEKSMKNTKPIHTVSDFDNLLKRFS
jgi:CRISPR/Cas system-associated endoribonuclease Cas2